jgi:hypothetical protein
MLVDGKPNPHDSILLVQSPQRAAVRAGDWKLLQSRGTNATNGNGKAAKKNGNKSAKQKAKQADTPANSPTDIGPELYNLREDPGEKNNLASSQPEVLARLSKQLDQWLQNAVPPGNPVEP